MGLDFQQDSDRQLFCSTCCQLGPLTWLCLAGATRDWKACSPVPHGAVTWLAWASSQHSWLRMVDFLPWWLVPKSKRGIGQSSQRLSPELAQGHATASLLDKEITRPALSWGKGNWSPPSHASGQEWPQPLLEMIECSNTFLWIALLFYMTSTAASPTANSML